MRGKTKQIQTALGHMPEQIDFYFELFSPKLLFHIPKARYEAFAERDVKFIPVWEALRNEPSEFVKRIKKVKYSLSNQEKFQKKLIDKETGCYQPCDDYMDTAVSEFVSRYMTSEKTWSDYKLDFIEKSKRFSEVFIVKNTIINLLRTFNGRSVFIYLQEHDEVLPEESEKYAAFFASSYKGQALIIPKNQEVYKRRLVSWKKNPGQIVSWKNY